MAYLGSTPKSTNSRSVIDTKEYLGFHADTSTNSGYYTFYANYTPGHVNVIVRGIVLAETDFIAINGTDIRISTSDVTLNNADVIQIVGYTLPVSNVLERSDVSISGGYAINMDRVESRYYMNKNQYAVDLHIPAGYNAFLAGPMNFTGTLTIDGVLNII